MAAALIYVTLAICSPCLLLLCVAQNRRGVAAPLGSVPPVSPVSPVAPVHPLKTGMCLSRLAAFKLSKTNGRIARNGTGRRLGRTDGRMDADGTIQQLLIHPSGGLM